jgi:organic hydroperoxide reductase OsmC/OhrA
MAGKSHDYRTRLVWNDKSGKGTSTYAGYSREYTVSVEGKPDFVGSADPMFKGLKEIHNPEDLFVAAISSCHMLTYLALCARRGVTVLEYADNATGTLVFSGNGGRFENVTLNPVVTIASWDMEALAITLHDDAHRDCYVAASCNTPITHSPVIRASAER